MTDRFSETTLSSTLAEALQRSPQVQGTLFGAAGGKLKWLAGDYSIHAVTHSYTDTQLDSRETDVLAVFRTAEHKLHWLLIEVKINAPFGRRQPEDYALRKQTAIALRRCDGCATVLVAPEQYLRAHNRDVRQFDVAISLEAIRVEAEKGTDLSDKLLVNHIDAAMRLFETGYIPLHDTLRAEQVTWYHAFVHEYKPHLVPNPTNAGRQSRDIFFPVPHQSRGYITHRIFAGEVSMMFMQRGNLFQDIQRTLMLSGQTSVFIEVRGTSLCLQLRNATVPAIDEKHGFAEQESVVLQGIDAVDDVYQWAVVNRELLAAIAEG